MCELYTEFIIIMLHLNLLSLLGILGIRRHIHRPPLAALWTTEWYEPSSLHKLFPHVIIIIYMYQCTYKKIEKNFAIPGILVKILCWCGYFLVKIWKERTLCYTFAGGFHSGCHVHSITKQTVSRHLCSDNSWAEKNVLETI